MKTDKQIWRYSYRPAATVFIAAMLEGATAKPTVVCHVDSEEGVVGCPADAPICVDAKGQAAINHGVKCVPCVNYYEHPAEPDWGCTAERPLCSNDGHDDGENGRPGWRTAGTQCRPYPCRNTKIQVGETDQGCTTAAPTCVDALGNMPLPGKFGVQCISYQSASVTVSTRAANPISSRSSVYDYGHAKSKDSPTWGTVRRPSCLITGETSPPPLYSLCSGCPFGISRKCEISKVSW